MTFTTLITAVVRTITGWHDFLTQPLVIEFEAEDLL